MDEQTTGTVEDRAAELAAETPPAELAKRAEAETAKAGGRKALAETFGNVVIEFIRPLEWEGRTWTRAELNFNGLTGRDMENIDAELGRDAPAFPATSRAYQRIFAAKACKIPSDAFDALSAADYNAVTTAARNFLLSTG